jgi:hypothetical protein
MLTLGRNPESALVAFVRAWFDLVGSGRLGEACAALDQPTSYGESWTPARLALALTEAFPPDSRLSREYPEGIRFTPASGAIGEPHVTFGSFDDGKGYWVDHDVPLNGVFSDLTAQFEFHGEGGRVGVALQDLHVL